MSEKTEHAAEAKAQHAVDLKAQHATEKKAAAKKKRFSGSTMLGYMATLTPDELAKVCSFFGVPCGASVLTPEGKFGSPITSHAGLWDSLKNMEEAYKMYGDELCDTICDYVDLLAGKPAPVEEK